VTCAAVSACPQDSSLSHVDRVGLDGPDGANMVDVGVARLLLSSGDTLTLGERGDDAAEVRKGKCPACGAPTLRTRKSDTRQDLSDLAPC
jgi:hypothetical protein